MYWCPRTLVRWFHFKTIKGFHIFYFVCMWEPWKTEENSIWRQVIDPNTTTQNHLHTIPMTSGYTHKNLRMSIPDGECVQNKRIPWNVYWKNISRQIWRKKRSSFNFCLNNPFAIFIKVNKFGIMQTLLHYAINRRWAV